MPPERRFLSWAPSDPGVGDGAPFFFFSGYELFSDRDRLMRLRELPHIGDDVAALRAAGYAVVFDIAGTPEALDEALKGRHPGAPGRPAAGVCWNGHGSEAGELIAADGRPFAPEALAPDVAGIGACRLFVLACCHAGAHAERWQRALGDSAHLFGWPMPVDLATGVDFYSPDAASERDLDDLLAARLGAPALGLPRVAETDELLRLEAEHAAFFGTNPLALDPSRLRIGRRVLAQWRDGRYYAATLREFDGLRYLASWDDGSEPTWVMPFQVRAPDAPAIMRVPGALRVGAHVRAPWADGAPYPARLIDFDGTRYLARWDDGSSPSWVEPAAIDVDGARVAPAVGMQVRALWRDGRYYPATLMEARVDQFLARWDDGSEPLWVDAADVQTP